MIYLDNSATTKPCRECVEKIHEALTDSFANPSSVHFAGLEAARREEYARGVIADLLGAESSEVYFTSGGTEANCTAVFGGVYGRRFKGKKGVVISAIEHSSVYESAKRLESEGFDVRYLCPDKYGRISADEIYSKIDENTVFVSLMLVNNELGTIEPVQTCADAVRRAGAPALIHCDAVQAFGKIPVNVRKLGVDMLTVSAHKIHGPKGVGALYIKKGVRIKPLLCGGEQEKKIRPGTESVPLIAGFGAAAQVLDAAASYEKVKDLNLYLRQRLCEITSARINSPEDALPYILNVSFPGVRSETLLNYLSENSVCVSSGSACAKGKLSHTLKALNIGRELADSAIRISFSDENTREDIDTFIELTKQWIGRSKR